MGKLKQDLFQLIKSLDKSEKRYFKRQALLHSESSNSSNNYIRLFDVLDKMDEYDEVAIKKQFEGEKFIKQLHVTKNYLYDSILKSLRSYAAYSTNNMQILSGIQNAEILIRKGHYEKALEFIHSTKLLARKTEFWGYYNELIELERVTHNIYRKPDTFKQIADINQKKVELIGFLKNESDYINLSYEIATIVINRGRMMSPAEMKKIKTINKSAILLDKNQAKTTFSKELYDSLKTAYLHLTNQFEKSLSETSSSIEYLKQRPFEIQKNPTGFLNKIFTHANALYILNRHDEANKFLNELTTFEKLYGIKLNPKLNGLILERSTQLKISYFSDTSQASAGFEYLKSVARDIEKNKVNISDDSMNAFYFTAAKFYMESKHYKEAVKCINQILVFNKSKFRQDETMMAKYLLLIVQFELGNKSMMQTVNNMFEAHELIEPLNFLRTMLPAVKDRATEKKGFQEFKKLLMLSKNKKVLDFYFNFNSWTENKIRNKSLTKLHAKTAEN